jgi:hypothetical protein
MRVRAVSITLAIAASSAAGLSAQPSTTAEQLVASAGRYVAGFVTGFANVVAEERMVQRSALDRRTQRLVSDYLLVREPGADSYMTFRDVLEVNGKPVPDREERLTQLFLEPFRNAVGRARRIEAHGARYNLPGMGDLNDPLMVLSFLQARYAGRFTWTLGKRDESVGPDAWSVQFRERQRPTIVKGSSNIEVPARGVVWIEGSTGRVLKTEVRFDGLRRIEFGQSFMEGRSGTPGSLGASDRIVVRFQYDEQFQFSVPSEMQEWHVSGSEQITATATYGRFRRFAVHTEEQIPRLPVP